MTHLSLCTGYGGLDLATGPPTWVAEVDPWAAKVCATRFPDAPNLGDLTRIPWADLGHVDTITAGYPCQPFSHAGKRKGTKDARHIWPHIADAVRALRPRRVVLENVAGHLSLGFGDVLGDLAEIGYDAQWCCVRASDAGAPHRRERVFIAAHPADTDDLRREGSVASAFGHDRRGDRSPTADTELGGWEAGTWLSHVPAERDIPARGDVDGLGVRPDVTPRALGATPAAHEPGGTVEDYHRRLNSSRGGDASFVPLSMLAPTLLPTPTTSDAHGPGQHGNGGAEVRTTVAVTDWKQYGPAIARWEQTIGRPAPAPVDDRRRLEPRFVEWMMGLSDGWVTDIIEPRGPALRALGNGVVPQQAALALELLGGARVPA